MDHARSDDPAVQQQLDRLGALSPGADVLGLERIAALLARLGDPQRRLPPVFHVAGTNGKGSTCSVLRAGIEAAGLRAHVYTSPHLVRFNERIRVAGTLVDDLLLAELLREVLDHGEGIGASFFEVTTAVAFLAFSRVPADACIVEVGLGGRLDATNVIEAPAVTGIAQLGIDHEAFLGDRIEQIAFEKAGIAKPEVPLVTMAYPTAAAAVVRARAAEVNAPLIEQGRDWDVVLTPERLDYRDAAGPLAATPPQLAGSHQAINAALALAMLRHQRAIELPEAALRAAPGWAEWPARLQRLDPGPLTDRLPAGSELRLDGGHNPAAGQAIASFIRAHAAGRPVHLIAGMLANKDAGGLLHDLLPLATTFQAVPVPGHAHHAPASLVALAAAHGVAAEPARDVAAALDALRQHSALDGPPLVMILGSLYLAGEVLHQNGQLPS